MKILPKVALLLACSLANNQDSPFYKPQPNVTSSQCQRPCQDIEDSIQTPYLVLIPFALGVSTCVITITYILFQAKAKPTGISATLWAVFILWAHVLISSQLYQNSHRAQAYVWSLHSTCQTLLEFGSLLRSNNILPSLGILSTVTFAWLMGPPVGLIGWHSQYHAQCGWSLHCLALIGIESAHSCISFFMQLVHYVVFRLSVLD